MSLSTDELLEVGVIIGTHGLRGDLKVRTLPTGDLALQSASQVFLKDRAGTLTRHETVRVSPHKQNILVRLSGLEQISAVRDLVGQSLWIHHDDVPELPEDLHYWHELEGLAVIDRQLGLLGQVAGMFTTPAHDILEVRDGEREVLIPVIPEFIERVDPEKGQVLVDLPEGLVPVAETESHDDHV